MSTPCGGFVFPGEKVVSDVLLPVRVDINGDGEEDEVHLCRDVASPSSGGPAAVRYEASVRPLLRMDSIQIGTSRFEVGEPFASVDGSSITGFRLSATPSEDAQRISIDLLVDYDLSTSNGLAVEKSAALYSTDIAVPPPAQKVIDAFPQRFEAAFAWGNRMKAEGLILDAISAAGAMPSEAARAEAFGTVAIPLIKSGDDGLMLQGVQQLGTATKEAERIYDPQQRYQALLALAIRLTESKLYGMAKDAMALALHVDPNRGATDIYELLWLDRGCPPDLRRSVVEEMHRVSADCNLSVLLEIGRAAVGSGNQDIAREVMLNAAGRPMAAFASAGTQTTLNIAELLHYLLLPTQRDALFESVLDRARINDDKEEAIKDLLLLGDAAWRCGLREKALEAYRQSHALIASECLGGPCSRFIERVRLETNTKLEALHREAN